VAGPWGLSGRDREGSNLSLSLSLSLSIYLYIYIYICIYIYIYICMYMYVCMCVCTYILYQLWNGSFFQPQTMDKLKQCLGNRYLVRSRIEKPTMVFSKATHFLLTKLSKMRKRKERWLHRHFPIPNLYTTTINHPSLFQLATYQLQ